MKKSESIPREAELIRYGGGQFVLLVPRKTEEITIWRGKQEFTFTIPKYKSPPPPEITVTSDKENI